MDIGGWLILADDRAPRHRDVRALTHNAWRHTQVVPTTDDILDETFTLVFRRLPFTTARRFARVIETAEKR